MFRGDHTGSQRPAAGLQPPDRGRRRTPVRGGPCVRHERIPPELRGRVFATFSAIALAVAPLGVLIAGSLIDTIGFSPTVLLFALGAQLLGLGMLTVPAFGELEAATSPDDAARSARLVRHHAR